MKTILTFICGAAVMLIVLAALSDLRTNTFNAIFASSLPADNDLIQRSHP